MNFNQLAAPVAALNKAGTDWVRGSGFLIKSADQVYLITAAHIANYQLAQMDDWSLWSERLSIYAEDGNVLANASLFDEGASERTPLFKFLRTSDQVHRIYDLIVLPVSLGEHMVNMSKIFVLPDDGAKRGKDDKVLTFGRIPGHSSM